MHRVLAPMVVLALFLRDDIHAVLHQTQQKVFKHQAVNGGYRDTLGPLNDNFIEVGPLECCLTKFVQQLWQRSDHRSSDDSGVLRRRRRLCRRTGVVHLLDVLTASREVLLDVLDDRCAEGVRESPSGVGRGAHGPNLAAMTCSVSLTPARGIAQRKVSLKRSGPHQRLMPVVCCTETALVSSLSWTASGDIALQSCQDGVFPRRACRKVRPFSACLLATT